MKKGTLIVGLLFFTFYCAWIPTLVAQSNKIDSLRNLIRADKADTSKVVHLNELSREYVNYGYYVLAQQYCDTALQLAESLKFQKGIRNSYAVFGLLHLNQGDYPKSLDYLFKTIEISKLLGDSARVANSYGSIGEVYRNLRRFPLALDYFFKALKIAEQIDDKRLVSLQLSNIGNTYFSSNKFTEALDYYSKALKIAESSGDKRKTALVLGNIGSVYNKKGELQNALKYYFQSFEMNKEAGSKLDLSANMANIGSTYMELKRYKDAEEYLLDALAIDSAIGALPYLRFAHRQLASLYEEMGNDKKAFEHFHQSVIIKDSLFNIEKDKEITRKELNNEFKKKTDAMMAESEKQRLLGIEEENKQRVIFFSIGGSLLLVLLFLLFVFRSLRVTHKQKSIIEFQKKEVSDQKRIIEEQKEIVDRKQKETVDSINYAKRIQQALLVNDDVLRQHLPEHFVLYTPKDIVSGDFYWAEKVNDRFLLAVCDCTGHGVPGAFMSLLNITKLNATVREKNIDRPDLILNQVRKDIIKVLNPEGGKEEGKDGMDAALCSFDFKNNTIQFASANSPFWIIRNGLLIESEFDKMPVGMHFRTMGDFSLHTLKLETGDCVYMFTDGYIDQFGGTSGKKFKSSQFKQTLLSASKLPIKEQREFLKQTIENWRGKLDQVDDILVIGIQI